MRTIAVAGSLLILTASTALAQAPKPMTPPPTAPAASPAQMAKFLVFFDWDRYNLTAEGKRVVAQAAEEFKRSGQARIVATGYTDLSGSAEYNQRLSERRADTVKQELIRLGVPATAITAIGRGEANPLVPTKDGVREPQNRRVEIEFPKPPAPPPAPPPPVQAKSPPPPPPPPELKGTVSFGPWYGHNLKERDNTSSGDQKSSNLLGPELRADYLVAPNFLVKGEAAGFNTLGTSQNDGYGGRFAVGFGYQWNLGAWHPFIGPVGGYILGKGVEDGFILGPEVGLKYDFSQRWGLYARAGYDRNFRNDIDQGIINAALGAAYRF